MGSKYKKKFEKKWVGQDTTDIKKATLKTRQTKQVKEIQKQADRNITNILKKQKGRWR